MVYHFNLNTLPIVTNIYTVTRNTTWEIADPCNILIIALDGECIIETMGSSIVLKNGSCILIPANQLHKRISINNTPCKMMYIHFTLAEDISQLSNQEAILKIESTKNNLENALLNSTGSFPIPMTDIFISQPSQPDSDTIKEICETINKTAKKYTLYNYLPTVIHFCELLSALTNHTLNYINTKDADINIVDLPHTLRKAILYINRNFFKKINVEDLCRDCNISQSQLTRYFKRTFNLTPAQYITNVKLNRAKEMLQTSPELSIKNISYTIGFEDQHYFSRVFYKVTGETPSEYRYRVTHFKSSPQNQEENNQETDV